MDFVFGSVVGSFLSPKAIVSAVRTSHEPNSLGDTSDHGRSLLPGRRSVILSYCIARDCPVK